jgi:hypothetical protein
MIDINRIVKIMQLMEINIIHMNRIIIWIKNKNKSKIKNYHIIIIITNVNK